MIKQKKNIKNDIHFYMNVNSLVSTLLPFLVQNALTKGTVLYMWQSGPILLHLTSLCQLLGETLKKTILPGQLQALSSLCKSQRREYKRQCAVRIQGSLTRKLFLRPKLYGKHLFICIYPPLMGEHFKVRDKDSLSLPSSTVPRKCTHKWLLS